MAEMKKKLKIISTLEQLRDTVKGYLFYGQKRSGKSTILSQTILELNKKGAFVVQIENLNLSDLNKNPLELVFYYNILSKLKESIFLKVLQERWPDLEIDIVNEDEFVKNTNPIEYFKDNI
jgi:AAA+ ATPase superfamily predicted ATPase